MPSGGHRPNSGRRAIDPTDPIAEFCVDRFNALRTIHKDHTRSLLKRTAEAPEKEHLSDLFDLYDELSQYPISQRKDLLKKPQGTILEDIQYILDQGLARKRTYALPSLSKIQRGQLYKQIADEVLAKFGTEITPRAVRRRIRIARVTI